jgi:hypothetical protein
MRRLTHCIRNRAGAVGCAPEYTLLLQVFPSRSERLLVEQIDYSLLVRRFVGFGLDDAA